MTRPSAKVTPFGHNVPTGFTASKLLWLVRHEPEAWERVRSVMLPHDYINLQLTGVKAMEAGDASGTFGIELDPTQSELIDERFMPIEPLVLIDLTIEIDLSSRCGDGVIDLGEACDDGPSNSDTLPDACRTVPGVHRRDGLPDTR